ncbi:L-amino-acid oxidase-like [Dasypus novemcinctus]|uniref:L-amino-acid oxidase-like n=1 Tax=Dasypus novemcinctus TaxID=9361 RepID=UPI0039C8C593
MHPGWLSLLLLSTVTPGDRAFSSQLFKCFEDPQYEEMVQLAKDGLGQTAERKSIVVIGAGMAGLTVTKTLQDAGHQVTVLEASGHVGGRIETHRVPGTQWYVDLGPMRIPSNHKLSREFIRKLGLKLNKFIMHNLQTWVLVNGVRRQVREVEASPHMLDYRLKADEEGKTAQQLLIKSLRKVEEELKQGTTCSQLLAKYDSFPTKVLGYAAEVNFKSMPEPPVAMASTALITALSTVLRALCPAECTLVLPFPPDPFWCLRSLALSSTDTLTLLLSLCMRLQEFLIKVGNLSRGAMQMIRDLMNVDIGYCKAFMESLRRILSFYNQTFDEITGGFDQLPIALHDSLLPRTVRLHSPVEEVEVSGNHVRIRYRTPNRPRPRALLTADYVVVATTSRAARLLHFQPPLSPSNEDALCIVHYHSAAKVALACTQRFWERDGIFGGYSTTDRPSRFIIYPSHIFHNGRGVLLASYTLDDDSAIFTAMDPARVVDVVLDDLAAIHNRPKEEFRALCPYSKVKDWSQDPYSMGAFISFTPYQYVDYVQELCQPQGRIYFVSEHTSLPLGWIDTAIKSGLRAAQDIQEAVNLASSKGPRDLEGSHPKTEL